MQTQYSEGVDIVDSMYTIQDAIPKDNFYERRLINDYERIQRFRFIPKLTDIAQLTPCTAQSHCRCSNAPPEMQTHSRRNVGKASLEQSQLPEVQSHCVSLPRPSHLFFQPCYQLSSRLLALSEFSQMDNIKKIVSVA